MAEKIKFPNREALEQALAMDMAKGLAASVGQMDAILAETPSEVGAA